MLPFVYLIAIAVVVLGAVIFTVLWFTVIDKDDDDETGVSFRFFDSENSEVTTSLADIANGTTTNVTQVEISLNGTTLSVGSTTRFTLDVDTTNTDTDTFAFRLKVEESFVTLDNNILATSQNKPSDTFKVSISNSVELLLGTTDIIEQLITLLTNPSDSGGEDLPDPVAPSNDAPVPFRTGVYFELQDSVDDSIFNSDFPIKTLIDKVHVNKKTLILKKLFIENKLFKVGGDTVDHDEFVFIPFPTIDNKVVKFMLNTNTSSAKFNVVKGFAFENEDATLAVDTDTNNGVFFDNDGVFDSTNALSSNTFSITLTSENETLGSIAGRTSSLFLDGKKVEVNSEGYGFTNE